MNRLILYCFCTVFCVGLVACGGGGGGGASCGGGSGSICAAGEFCNFDDFSCGSGGHCEAIPSGCEAAQIPVCSCLGLAFFNECFAMAAGQSVRSLGDC